MIDQEIEEIKMANTRARKGGELGLNREWYEGGQFLPNNEDTIKGDRKHIRSSQARKQEIAPYKWVLSDKEAIWPKVSPVCKFHKTGYSKESGAEGWLEVIIEPGAYWSEKAIKEFQALVDMWNKGQRWI